jgi:hypothetical protein
VQGGNDLFTVDVQAAREVLPEAITVDALTKTLSEATS